MIRKLLSKSVVHTMVTAAVATVSVIGIGASGAHAASAGWGPAYDLNRDGCNDITLYYNSAGRVTGAYLTTGPGCRWDTMAHDLDQNGTFDEIYFDTQSPGGQWDALLYGNQLFTNSGSYNFHFVDPHGTEWWIMKPISATAGPPSYGTVGGQYNALLALARRTGYTAK